MFHNSLIADYTAWMTLNQQVSGQLGNRARMGHTGHACNRLAYV